jgi:transcriptional regulator with XRE-family HTH domain
MSAAGLLQRARNEAGLTQEAVAQVARTSRPTLSAYEHGRKSPTLETAQRLLAATGHEFDVVPLVVFTEYVTSRGRVLVVPNRLQRLPVREALATVALPLHLNWSEPGRVSNLADRQQRARLYEAVLREGGPADITAFIDGALLIDLWTELVLPRHVRRAWTPVISAALQDASS